MQNVAGGKMNIPDRIIEAICNNEVKAEDYYEVYGKENLEKRCAEVYASNIEILQKYSVEDMKLAIAQKLKKSQNQQNLKENSEKMRVFNKKNAQNHEKSQNSKKKYIFANSKVVFPAMAAAVLAAIILPTMLISQNNHKNIDKNENFRVKGASNFQNSANSLENQKTEICLYRKNDDGVQLLEDGDFAKNGDVIQITYKPGNNKYGVIFSVDGNGNITRHFPEKSWESEKLSHEKSEIPLNFSYELDNAPDFECFVMVSSKNQFNLEDIERRIKKSDDIEYLKGLSFLPKTTDGTVFVLEK